MAAKITYKFREELSRKGEIVPRPVAEVFVKSSKGEWHLFYPYVDSGADITLFRRSDCKLLGFKLRKGESLNIGGLSGHTIKAYIHNLVIRIGKEKSLK